MTQIVKQIDKKTLQLCLLKACKLVGITEPPSQAMMEQLSLFVMKKFPEYRDEDLINEAFQHAAMLELSHFNSFSYSYLAKVFNRHRDERRVIKRKEESETPPPPDNRATPKQLYDLMIKLATKEQQLSDVLPYTIIFDYMRDKGIVNASDDALQARLAKLRTEQSSGTPSDDLHTIGQFIKGTTIDIRDVKILIIKEYLHYEGIIK